MRRTAARLVTAAGACALASGLLSAPSHGEDPPAKTPPLPPLAARDFEGADRRSSVGPLQFSDLVGVSLTHDAEDWIFQAEMRRDLAEGMFTRIDVDWDCDGRRAENEVETNAAVGSRFRPSSYVPGPGERAPIELVRSSWASRFDETQPSPLESPAVSMTHWAALAVPSVGGPMIRFRVPRKLIDDRGARAATTPPAFRVTARTTCAEHPLVFDYDASTGARDVRVDGDGSEWSGGPYAEDAAGELHPAVRHLDLAAAWCEHSADRLFLRVDFAAPGFGRIARSDGDVFVDDELVVSVEPLGVAYMDPMLLHVPATAPGGEAVDTRRSRRAPADGARGEGRAKYVCGDSVVELSIPRPTGQARVRVALWTEAARYDRLDPEWNPIPPAGAK